MVVWRPVGVAVSIDTLLALTNSPSRHALMSSLVALDRRSSTNSHQPAIPRRSGWSPELPSDPDQQPLTVCTLVGSADKRLGEQTRGQDVRLRRQVGKSWRRSKRQSAVYLQDCPTTHIAGRADTHPDALPPGPEGASPSGPCEPMGATTIHSCFLALSTMSPPSSVTVLDPASPNVGVNISLPETFAPTV